MRDYFTGGDSELTGKLRRSHTRGIGQHAEYGDVVGRFGGVKKAFRELRHFRQSPGVLARAIARRSGKIYRQLREAVAEEFRGKIKEARAPERPTVGPHDALAAKCKRCGVAHGRGAHRFHGRGAFLQTHLFPYKMNPPATARLVSSRVLRIEAQKTAADKHHCDAGCRASGHRYYHPFGAGVRLYELSNGDLWLSKRSYFCRQYRDRPGRIYGRVLTLRCVVRGKTIEKHFPAGVEMYGLANKDLLLTKRR